MWGTPQRSRRISTGFRRPGTATVSARSHGAIKIAQQTVTPRIYLSDFEADGVVVAGLESVLPDDSDLLDLLEETDLPEDSEPEVDPLPFSLLAPAPSLLLPPSEPSSLGFGSLLFPLP